MRAVPAKRPPQNPGLNALGLTYFEGRTFSGGTTSSSQPTRSSPDRHLIEIGHDALFVQQQVGHERSSPYRP